VGGWAVGRRILAETVPGVRAMKETWRACEGGTGVCACERADGQLVGVFLLKRSLVRVGVSSNAMGLGDVRREGMTGRVGEGAPGTLTSRL
jgi:hypothetical protein